MYLQILWVLVLTSLLVLLRPCDTEALSLGYTNSNLGAYSSAVQLLTVNSREILPGKQSDLVFPDYLQRSHIISVYEEKVAQSPDSSIFLRLLADQYLRRFREIGDIDDVLRAEQAARRSLALQPRHNQVSSMLLASALLSQHQFREALNVLNNSSLDNPNIVSLLASIQMELGDYEATHQLLQNLAQEESNSGHNAVLARYLELTGNLASARQLLDKAMQEMDSFYTTSAETRAWFHVRTGDLAFAVGDFALSEQRYREAFDLFPRHIAAFTGLARLYAAQHRWQDVLNIANQGIELMPLVETLGYKADAQVALGDQEGAAETEDLIGVVAYLSKFKGIYDRAMAVYYTEHGIHLPEALQIARSEVAVRDDVYAEDTLAWAAAANGQWQEAQKAAQRATRFGTEDALLQFHAGMIAFHLGNREEAIKRLTQAVSLNPQFHHKYADQARQVLANLVSSVSFPTPNAIGSSL
ncbi:tetratricopeptide repeat protein [Nostoc sp. 'Peltigera membranacea cyanobiont' N6]|uniref:tetratricopeptide repeat protein n=1 Tax=Nostoc sp. 'Peltigera membranacea cyanobiont' N6 TaxID=1261031 RepID=UPI000CF35D94|nr:tetratricopeptide repeat protein [Nostoc sp. 'Peltigera membranacea cyanobiont' N6]AVH66256.1 TPR repeat-containing protein [Nostoc sp. 'Peltigera membranacea cyanobiont' N6]